MSDAPTTPSAFRKDPEDLLREAADWLESVESPRTVARVTEICDALRNERASRAGTAGIIRDQNIQIGELEERVRIAEGDVRHMKLVLDAQRESMLALRERVLVRVQLWLDDHDPLLYLARGIGGLASFVRR